MKQYILLSAALLMAAAGCTKEVIQTSEIDSQTEVEAPVPMKFGFAQPEVTLKSVGSLEAWNNSPLYIFAFPVGTTDFSDPEDMIWNNKVIAESGETASELTITQDDSSEPYYYEGTTIYDFFGYYVDDAAATVAAEDNWTNIADPTTTDPTPIVITEATGTNNGTELTQGLYIPIVINGSQDIMAATTDKAADGTVEGGASENVDASLCYSAYSARRDVVPNMKFEHQLARFIFKIKAGAEDGNDVLVSNITLKSASRGYLRVTGDRGIVAAATQPEDQTLYLMQKPAEPAVSSELVTLAPTSVSNKYETGSVEDPGASQIGETLMVFPGESEYEMSYTVQMSENGEEVVTHVPLTRKMFTEGDESAASQDSFEAGYTYTLTLIIYGLQDIRLDASVEKWKDGGESTWNPEDAFTTNGE